MQQGARRAVRKMQGMKRQLRTAQARLLQRWWLQGQYRSLLAMQSAAASGNRTRQERSRHRLAQKAQAQPIGQQEKGRLEMMQGMGRQL